jgi:pimeloyl-ACP methyl ester carboxylesterase
LHRASSQRTIAVVSETPVPAWPKWKRRLWRVGRVVLLVYVGLICVNCMFQEQLIFPGTSSQGQKHAQIETTQAGDIVFLNTSRGDKIAVLFGKAVNQDHPETRPTLIFFYGNAMCLADAKDFCRGWRKLGANVLGVEYPGYGMSSGKAGEQALYAAADAAYDYLLSRPDIDKTKIIPVGLSIGTGVAIDLASRRPVAALALFAPYTSLDDLARHVMPFLPTGLILKHHFRNEQKIADLDMPILIAHGENDSIIPVEMSHRLVKAATKARVTTLFIDADHNDLFEVGGEQLDAALGKLIQQVMDRADASRGSP